MLDVDRKCMLYSFCDSVRGKPAGVNKMLLCSFHFFERLPEVSSQYIQMGKTRVRWPFASTLHRLPSTGLVKVHTM